MDPRMLVAYSSKYGATEEIARAIGRTLEAAGFEADVKRCKDVKDLEPYAAVVLGSAVYIGRWRREAADFLRYSEAQLAKKPTWLFSSGPTGEGDPAGLLKGWDFPEALEPVAERIRPRDIAVFSGALDRSKLQPFDAFIIRTVKAPIGDFRDMDAVTGWAQGIASALQGEFAPVGA